jgi:methylmalonyl-CoA mutase N-terminal domain/subunit
LPALLQRGLDVADQDLVGETDDRHVVGSDEALDETLALPTAESAEIALRTQQVLMDETGVTAVADPLGGSWYVESLTDRLEADAERIFATILSMGGDTTMTAGILRGIEDGWFSAEIADAAFAYQQALEKGDKHIVGVTDHSETVTSPPPILRIAAEVETEQVASLAQRRSDRDARAVSAALADLGQAANGSGSTIPAMLDAVRAEATLGEICDVLRTSWGTYTEPARF